MFLAAVIIVYKSGIHLEGVEAGSTFVYLHIHSHGSPWKAVPSSDPACTGFTALQHSPALAGWTRKPRAGQFCLLSVTFWSHFPAHNFRAPLWSQSPAQESPATHLNKHILRWVCFASITGLIVQVLLSSDDFHLELILNPVCFLPQDHTF